MFQFKHVAQQHVSRITINTITTRSISNSTHTASYFQSFKAVKRPTLIHRTPKQHFSTEEAVQEATIEHLNAAPQAGFVSRALRTKASAKYKNVPIAPRKLEYLSKLIRGLNVREAIIQLRLSSKRKSYFLRKGIRTLANTAMNTFNMSKDRLIVSEISSTRGRFTRKIEFRARGRANLRVKRKSHLFITLAEQPYHKGEVRIGRYGRTIDTWTKFDKLSEAWKLKKAEEGM